MNKRQLLTAELQRLEKNKAFAEQEIAKVKLQLDNIPKQTVELEDIECITFRGRKFRMDSFKIDFQGSMITEGELIIRCYEGLNNAKPIRD